MSGVGAREPARAPRVERSAVLLLWVAALGVCARGIALNAGFLHDDAFITLRYVQNLLAGDGVAWNPGDRVEGYTNFLQLLSVGALGALGVDLVRATRVVAFAAYAATFAFMAVWLARRDDPRTGDGRHLVAWSLPLAVSVGSVPLVAWGFGGLEAPLSTACVAAGVLLVADVPDAVRPERRAFAGGLALALACMTRPDAALFVACGAVLVAAPRGGRVRWRVALAYAAPLVALLGPWLLWKLAYYGAVVPNTFHVKAADPSVRRLTQGLAYVGAYVATPPFALVALALGAARAAVARRLRAGVAFALACVALHVAWVSFVGGDQMPAFRLLVPIVPVVAWLGLETWRADLERLGARGRAGVAVAVAAAIALQLLWPGTGERNANATAFVGRAVGDWIGSHWRPGSLVALNTAGSTPYHAPGFRYVDMLGLNDAHIARRPSAPPRVRGQLLPGHAKGDGAYVLDQRPDYVILGPAHGALAHRPWFLSDVEIAEDPRFAAGYAKRQARIDVTGYTGWASLPETASGSVLFTWYERRTRDR